MFYVWCVPVWQDFFASTLATLPIKAPQCPHAHLSNILAVIVVLHVESHSLRIFQSGNQLGIHLLSSQPNETFSSIMSPQASILQISTLLSNESSLLDLSNITQLQVSLNFNLIKPILRVLFVYTESVHVYGHSAPNFIPADSEL